MNQIQHEREVVNEDIPHIVSKAVTWAYGKSASPSRIRETSTFPTL